MEGLMGLGFNIYNNDKNIVERLKREGKIERGIYWLDLWDEECKEESKLIIGGMGII